MKKRYNALGLSEAGRELFISLRLEILRYASFLQEPMNDKKENNMSKEFKKIPDFKSEDGRA